MNEPSHAEALRFLGYATTFRVGDITVERLPHYNDGWRLSREDGGLVRAVYAPGWHRYEQTDPRSPGWYGSLPDALAAAEDDYEQRTGRKP